MEIRGIKNNADSTAPPHIFANTAVLLNYVIFIDIALKVAILHNLFVFPWTNDAFYASSLLFMAEKNWCIV